MALGVAVGLWVALGFVVLPAWDRWEQERLELPLRESALFKYRQALATAGSEAASGEALQSRLREAEGGLLQGATAALASAELQQWVRETAAAHGIEVRSSQFIPVRSQGSGYTQVALGLQFLCRLDQLVNFVAAVQAAPKTLAIPRFQVQAIGGDEKFVDVNLTVAGVMRSGD